MAMSRKRRYVLRISGTALQGPCIYLPTSTATPTPMADESMADEFKVEESMADNTLYNSVACNIHGGEIYYCTGNEAT